MRTVLLGTDFVYDKNNNLIPIEINTNLDFDNNSITQDMDEIVDFTYLDQLILTNNFNEVVYLGSLIGLSQKFENHWSGTSITYTFIETNPKSITVPFVEDGENKLIIRSAYDSTALVDSEYCANNINFLNLISGQTFGSEVAYKDESEQLVNRITHVNDNGDHPNFILKSIDANYDENVYPKLFKFSSLEEVSSYMENIPSGYFLMHYHFNDTKLFQNHCVVLRGWNILYPPSLESVSIGGYSKITNLALDDIENIYDSQTKELNTSAKEKYITTVANFTEPKLLDTDLVQMADGSFKTALDLQVGDVVRTIDIPNSFNVDTSKTDVNFQISYDEFLSGSTFSSNTVVAKKKVSKIANIIDILFTDGTTWHDTAMSYYLIEEDNQIKFKRISLLEAGDKVILISSNENQLTSVQKTVQSISTNRLIFRGWVISVANEYMFLTKTTEEGDNSSYVSVEHNLYVCNCGPCAQCPKQCESFQQNWCVYWGGPQGWCANCSEGPCSCY